MIEDLIRKNGQLKTLAAGRPSRKALSLFDAFAELRKNGGTRFDGEIVETFVRCFSGTETYAA